MANSSKNKGDKAERDAVQMLKDKCPDLLVEDAMRMLGAGRKDDVGDLRVFADVAVQVKCYAPAYMAAGLRQAAKGATAQALNGRVPLALGLVPIPRQPTTGAVRWLAVAEQWPVQPPIEPVRFAAVNKALAWLKDDLGPYGYLAHPRERRIATFGASLTDTVLVAPVEAWIAAYRQALACGAAPSPVAAHLTIDTATTDALSA